MQRASSVLLISAALVFAVGLPLRAQDDQVLLPEQSAAKAKQLIQEMIQALGGSAYLNVKDSTCTGMLGSFGHSGALSGYDNFWDYVKFPDKDRTEFSKKRNQIQITNGKQGWVLDRGGVSEEPASQLADNQRELQVDLDYILRYRLNEPGMIFRYDGPDIVDLKEADWVELDDPQGHQIRIAIAKLTHLPIRKEVAMRDPVTHMRTEEVDYYSNFHSVNGITVYFQQTHIRNGLKVFQVFYNANGCKFNTGLQDSLFTKESLDERWAHIDKKGRKKNKDGKDNKDNRDSGKNSSSH
ncbi:MAG TPA: hypothetical protein VND42_02990 [Candidatus Acidoferrales bacterium]|nr:hypothetical protein [Candidatus Acidoferrales bacterium]